MYKRATTDLPPVAASGYSQGAPRALKVSSRANDGRSYSAKSAGEITKKNLGSIQRQRRLLLCCTRLWPTAGSAIPRALPISRTTTA
ncbi:g8966 [Coccomyxa viridis]|uniref:G8966 protein n=1 Tax=Coccomyxa viridis TaxID=1274662 RepID=A0ABP1G1R4_9CHLO